MYKIVLHILLKLKLTSKYFGRLFHPDKEEVIFSGMHIQCLDSYSAFVPESQVVTQTYIKEQHISFLIKTYIRKTSFVQHKKACSISPVNYIGEVLIEKRKYKSLLTYRNRSLVRFLQTT